MNETVFPDPKDDSQQRLDRLEAQLQGLSDRVASMEAAERERQAFCDEFMRQQEESARRVLNTAASSLSAFRARAEEAALAIPAEELRARLAHTPNPFAALDQMTKGNLPQ